jgi:flagellar protein FlbD
VTLISGERVLVRESMDEVMQRAVQYQQSKLLLPPARPAARLASATT